MLLSIVFIFSSVFASGTSEHCSEFFKAAIDFQKAKTKANQERAKTRSEDIQTDWKYRLALLLGDAQMAKTIEKSKNESQISKSINISSFRFSSEYNKFEWMDIIAQMPPGNAVYFLETLYQSSENFLPYAQRFSDLINGLIKRKTINYSDAKKMLEKFNSDGSRINFIFSNVLQETYVAPKQNHGVNLKISSMIKRSDLSSELKKEWSTLLIYNFPGDDILEALDAQLTTLPNEKLAIEFFKHFLDYLNTLKKSEQLNLIKGLSPILNKTKSSQWYSLITGIEPTETKQSLLTSRAVERFLSHQQKIQEYKYQIKNEILTKRKKTNNNQTLADSDITKIEEEAFRRASIYKQTLNQCRRNKNGLSKEEPLNKNDLKNQQRFRNFKVLMGLSITGGIYSWVHRDEPWGEFPSATPAIKQQRLSYEMVWVAISKVISTFIISGKSLHFGQKYLYHYALGAVQDVFYSGGIALLFESNEEEIKKEIEMIQTDPEYKKKIEALVTKFEKEKTVERIFNKTIDFLKNQEVPKGKNLLEAIESEADLEKPEIEEALARLLSKQIYENSKKSDVVKTDIKWIDSLKIPTENTGYAFSDLYSFHRKWGVIFDVKSLLLGLYIYNLLCKNADNPAMSYLQAGFIVIIDNIITRELYFEGRKQFVNLKE